MPRYREEIRGPRISRIGMGKSPGDSISVTREIRGLLSHQVEEENLGAVSGFDPQL